MLKEICLTNYRNLSMPDAVGFDPLTILVGPNGFGKTNLLRVLRFIRDSWVGSVDESRRVTRFEDAIIRWGNINILDAALPVPSNVVVEAEMVLQTGYVHGLVQELRVNETSVIISRESISRRQQDTPKESPFLYYDAEINKNKNLIYIFDDSSHSRGELKSVGSLPANELAVHSLQKWLSENGETLPRDTPLYEGHRLLQYSIEGWSFYDSSQMSLDAIRQARQEIGLNETVLTSSGENLPLVLFNLCRDIDFQERLVKVMQQMFPDTRTLRPNIIGRTSLTIEWYKRGFKRPFFLDEMSDGTIRMLCWASILLSPEPSSLIVLDEPEASLHPAWLGILAGWIREAARRTQVIVSTHSSDLLDYFTEDAASVRVFERDTSILTSDTNAPYVRVRPLNPATIADKLAEGWKLGDLYRVGDPELGGWPW